MRGESEEEAEQKSGVFIHCVGLNVSGKVGSGSSSSSSSSSSSDDDKKKSKS